MYICKTVQTLYLRLKLLDALSFKLQSV